MSNLSACSWLCGCALFGCITKCLQSLDTYSFRTNNCSLCHRLQLFHPTLWNLNLNNKMYLAWVAQDVALAYFLDSFRLDSSPHVYFVVENKRPLCLLLLHITGFMCSEDNNRIWYQRFQLRCSFCVENHTVWGETLKWFRLGITSESKGCLCF